jgi:choice-of-anchor B domain-containing protein
MIKKILLATSVIAISAGIAPAQNYNITLAATLPYPGQTLANICGFVDTVGNEYALVGAQNGMSIVDVTNPGSPVQVAMIPGPINEWKEIKTWGRYAYVTSEGGGGLQIVDLRNLPGTNLPTANWQPIINGTQLNTIHSLHIDAGRVYLYGSNIGAGGIIIGDLSSPMSPVYLGRYNADYVHDGYVRNSKVYAARIYAGECTVIDVSNPASPVALQSWQTPGVFTHNTWLNTASDSYCFTTDEVNNSWLAAYDITNLANVTLVDQIQSQNPGSGSIVHNTHIINKNGRDYAVTSWYKDGIVITDVTKPANMVNVGWYDTYPQGSGGGFNGCWGVYPFLPSGTIVASDIDNGLYVLTPTYVAACYIQGNVTDSITNAPIANASVSILTTQINETANLAGFYQTGIGVPGTYSVQFSRPGYITKVINNISFTSGNTDTLDVQLVPLTPFVYTGQVVDAVTSQGVPFANIKFSDVDFTLDTIADGNGNFTIPGIFAGSYEVIAGKWGWITSCMNNFYLTQASSPLIISLGDGIYDDFTWDWGWTESGNATTGNWVRAVPLGTLYNTTPANPGADVTNDCSDEAYVTGNSSTNVSADDVDGGATILTSPVFNAASLQVPYLFYSRWFFNDGGTGNPNDSLNIYLTNGTQTVTLETVLAGAPGNSSWVDKTLRIADYMTPAPAMQLIIRTADANPGHIVEAGFDKFQVVDSLALSVVPFTVSSSGFVIYPNPNSGEFNIQYTPAAHSPARIEIYNVLGTKVFEKYAYNSSGKEHLNLEILTPGLYLCRIVAGDKSFNNYFVKE